MSLLDSFRAVAEHPELGDKGLKGHLDRVAQRVEAQDEVMAGNSIHGPVDFILEIFRRSEVLAETVVSAADGDIEDQIEKEEGSK